MEEKELEEKKKKDLKKKIATGVVASVTSASVLLGGTFDSPKDIINDEYHKKPITVVETLEDDYDEDSLEENTKENLVLKEKIKRLIYKIPVKIRAITCIPLWGLGTVILALFSLLFRFVSTTLLTFVFNFLMTFLVMFLVVVISLKLLFPGIPLRKLLNKKTFLFIFIGSLVISVCDVFIPMFWKEYTYYRNLSKFIIGLIFLVIIMRPFIKKKFKEMNELEVVYG